MQRPEERGGAGEPVSPYGPGPSPAGTATLARPTGVEPQHPEPASSRVTVALGWAIVVIMLLFVAGAVGSALFVAGSTGSVYEEQPVYEPPYSEPEIDTQPGAPEGAKPGSIAGFGAPRGDDLFAEFTLEQSVAASQAIADATIAAAGPIVDPAIAPGTTSFPVGSAGCNNTPGGRVAFEVWFIVDDVPAAIGRVRALWEASGYTLLPTSSEGRYGYGGRIDSPVDLLTIENKSGTVRLTVQSVCTPGEDL